jgi:hypothetical protein
MIKQKLQFVYIKREEKKYDTKSSASNATNLTISFHTRHCSAWPDASTFIHKQTLPWRCHSHLFAGEDAGVLVVGAVGTLEVHGELEALLVGFFTICACAITYVDKTTVSANGKGGAGHHVEAVIVGVESTRLEVDIGNLANVRIQASRGNLLLVADRVILVIADSSLVFGRIRVFGGHLGGGSLSECLAFLKNWIS